MKRVLCFCVLGISWSCNAIKDKVTVYNQSNSTILIALDTKERPPVKKDSIDTRGARNFYLPEITAKQPYYLLVDTEGEQRLFTINLVGKNVVLRRGDQDLAQVPVSVFENGGLSIVIYGTIHPNLPEARLVSAVSPAEREAILHPQETEAEIAAEEKEAHEAKPGTVEAVFEEADSDFASTSAKPSVVEQEESAADGQGKQTIQEPQQEPKAEPDEFVEEAPTPGQGAGTEGEQNSQDKTK